MFVFCAALRENLLTMRRDKAQKPNEACRATRPPAAVACADNIYCQS
jgi:hypothetical protein